MRFICGRRAPSSPTTVRHDGPQFCAAICARRTLSLVVSFVAANTRCMPLRPPTLQLSKRTNPARKILWSRHVPHHVRDQSVEACRRRRREWGEHARCGRLGQAVHDLFVDVLGRVRGRDDGKVVEGERRNVERRQRRRHHKRHKRPVVPPSDAVGHPRAVFWTRERDAGHGIGHEMKGTRYRAHVSRVRGICCIDASMPIGRATYGDQTCLQAREGESAHRKGERARRECERE